MLIEALKRQFLNAFTILEESLSSFNKEQWREGKSPYDGPARATIHVLQCADFYTCEDDRVFHNFAKPVWEMSDNDLPSQNQMLEYLQAARDKTIQWLDSIGNEGLGKPSENEYSINALEKVAYALRHLQHHIGEICAYQKQLGIEPATWK